MSFFLSVVFVVVGVCSWCGSAHRSYDVRPRHAQAATVDPDSINWSSLLSVKNTLERLRVTTQTPGLKGDARRDALQERLRSALAIHQHGMQMARRGEAEPSSTSSNSVESTSASPSVLSPLVGTDSGYGGLYPQLRPAASGSTLGPRSSGQKATTTVLPLGGGGGGGVGGATPIAAPVVPKLDLGLFKVPVAPCVNHISSILS